MPSLYPLQLQDARTLAARRAGLLLYEPGLGKTATAIKAAEFASPTGQWSVVTKRDAIDQWQEELQLWAPGRQNVVLAHYEALDRPDVLAAVGRGRVVLFDESHEARDVNTRTWRQCYQAAKAPAPGVAFKRTYLLTATPVFNGVPDLLAQLVLAGIYDVSQYSALLWRYTVPQLGGIHSVLNYQTAARVPELKAVLDAVAIRRSYADFGLSLPPLIPSKIPVQLDLVGAGADYTRAAADFGAWYRETRGTQLPPLARFTTLRRLQSMAKAQAVAQRVELERRAGGNVLVFTEFRDTAEALARQLPGSRLVLGGQSVGGRAQQLAGLGASAGAPAGQAVVATLDTLDSALNLPAVTRVFYVDLPWTPAQLDQTFKRAWRQRQTRPVSVAYFFLPNDEAEKHVSSVLLRKTQLLAALGLEPFGSFRQIGFT